MLANLGFSYIALRNFEAADKTVDRAIAIAPHSFETVGLKGYLAAILRGDLETAEKQLSSIAGDTDPSGVLTWMRFWIFVLQRKFPEAVDVLQKFPGDSLLTNTTARSPKSWLQGRRRSLKASVRSNCYPNLRMLSMDRVAQLRSHKFMH
jgi:hypothetical protein